MTADIKETPQLPIVASNHKNAFIGDFQGQVVTGIPYQRLMPDVVRAAVEYGLLLLLINRWVGVIACGQSVRLTGLGSKGLFEVFEGVLGRSFRGHQALSNQGVKAYATTARPVNWAPTYLNG